VKILEISGEWRHKDDVLYKPPEKKKSHEVKSGDRGGHRINALSSVSSLGPGRAGRGAMHRQPSSRNFAYHFSILLKRGAAFWNSARNRNGRGYCVFQNTK
jgi:hypothetical protein